MRYLGTAALTMMFGWGGIAVLAFLVWLLPQVPDPFWPFPLVLAAMPLAAYLAEWRLVKRRALLGALTEERGHLRGFLWKGRLLQTGAVVAAIVIMTALYLSASFLQWQHWAVLIGYVAVLGIATGPVQAMLGPEVSGAHLKLIVRHGPLFWGGIMVLGTAFIGLDLVLDQPDLRRASFDFVVETAYAEGFEGARSASLGALLGMTNAARTGVWYWAQMIGPQLDAAAWAFWLVFVIIIGGIASLLNAYVLAAIGVAERIGRLNLRSLAHPFHIGVTASVAVIGAFYAFASYELSRQSPEAFNLPEGQVAGYLDPCRTDQTRQKVEALTADFAAFSQEERSRTGDEIDAAARRAFATLEPAVDEYLDWYFSLVGEYSRLWQAVAGDGAAFIGGKFREIVLTDGAIDAGLAEELEAIEGRSNGRMGEMASLYAQALRDALDDSRCLAGAVPVVAPRKLDSDLRHVTGAAAGSLAGVAAGVAVATRLGLRMTAGRGASSLFRGVTTAVGKTAAKRGASAGGAAAAATVICSPSGPGALLCGALAGIGMWVGVDAVVLWGDEYLHRDGMRADIMKGLDETRRRTVDALAAANAARIELAVEEMNRSRNRMFSPIREGLGRGED